jgi:hypothetical protein
MLYRMAVSDGLVWVTSTHEKALFAPAQARDIVVS